MTPVKQQQIYFRSQRNIKAFIQVYYMYFQNFDRLSHEISFAKSFDNSTEIHVAYYYFLFCF